MAKVRARFSRNSKYYISKSAFLTAFWWCLNYPEWKSEHDLGISPRSSGNGSGGGGISDPTAVQAIRLSDLAEKIELIERTAYEAEPELHPYLLMYVTREDLTFDKLKALGMACERKMFYDRRRKFYWLLSQRLKL